MTTRDIRYRCNSCGHEFDHVITTRVQERSADPSVPTVETSGAFPPCPHCGEFGLTRLSTTVREESEPGEGGA